MGYNSKNIRAVVKTFLKVNAKNLVKVTRTGELMDRKRPPTLYSVIKIVLLKHVFSVCE